MPFLITHKVGVHLFTNICVFFFVKARLTSYRKAYEKAKSAFYSRVTIQQRKKIKEIRRGELSELMATMTLEELRERAFNPPEGRSFSTRLECLE